MRVGKFSISTSLLIRTALKKGFDCTFLPEKVINISDGTTSHYFRGTSLPCNDAVASSVSDNKYFLRRLLREEKLPVPRTITLRHPAAWKNILEGPLQFPLVVKPISASHANGATMNITTEQELEHAVKRAFDYIKKHKRENRVLVEEYFDGHDLRFFIVNKEVVSVVKREPAYVVGDGNSTIRQLIRAFNDQWKSSIKYDLPLCPIPIDNEVYRHLGKQNLKLDSVIPEGEKVSVRWNANVSTGGRPSDVTDEVHPFLKNLALRAAELSHLEVSGVDMLCKDISSGDASDNNASILEINAAPGFDIHHFPVSGKSRDVISAILDHIFHTPNRVEELTPARIEHALSKIPANQYESTPSS